MVCVNFSKQALNVYIIITVEDKPFANPSQLNDDNTITEDVNIFIPAAKAISAIPAETRPLVCVNFSIQELNVYINTTVPLSPFAKSSQLNDDNAITEDVNIFMPVAKAISPIPAETRPLVCVNFSIQALSVYINITVEDMPFANSSQLKADNVVTADANIFIPAANAIIPIPAETSPLVLDNLSFTHSERTYSNTTVPLSPFAKSSQLNPESFLTALANIRTPTDIAIIIPAVFPAPFDGESIKLNESIANIKSPNKAVIAINELVNLS